MSRGRASIPQHIRETLGENIRRERVIRKMTQAELGKRIHTSQMMVSRFEKGIDSPSVWRCYLIARVFGTTIEQLLTDREPPVQPILSEEPMAFREPSSQLIGSEDIMVFSESPRPFRQSEEPMAFRTPPVQPVRSEETVAFGNWLKDCRERKKMSSDDVAEIVGSTAGYLRYIESGWGMPDENLREALTALFGDASGSTREKRTKNPIAVQMPDGTWVSENTGIDTFIEVIKAMGIEEVKKLDLHVNRIPLIADYDHPGKAQRKIETEAGVYWIVSGTDQAKKKRILENIAARLKIDMSIFLR